MLLGRVIGTVVSTRKEDTLEGLTLLLVKPCDADGNPIGAGVTPALIVCADAVGAGVGEVVLYCAGSSARQTRKTKDRPVDHAVIAIVDQVEQDGARRYLKD